ncbi:peptidylprolyl isomerase [Porticoccaceae bacterium LTM1]|nr:peptidylprolyl isomerase [Porticoccaceae bacterium LTM1]
MSLTDTPEIRVNGQLISPAMIDAEVQYHPAETRREAMIQAAETLIIGELFRQRAQEVGLASASSSPSELEEQATFDQLVNQEAQIPQVTKEECERFFEANPDRFCSPPILEVRHILLAADPQDINERAKIEQQATALINQLESGESTFAELVTAYSACPSSATGGSLGQISKSQTVPEFERQVFAANEGLMPRPVESRYGFHIVEVARKIPGKPLPFEMVEAKIASYLQEKVKRKATSQYIQQLINNAHIEGFWFDVESSPLMQ